MHYARSARVLAIASMLALVACSTENTTEPVSPADAVTSRIDGRVSTSVAPNAPAELVAPRLEGKTNLVGVWSREHTVLTCTVRFKQVTSPNWFPRSGVIVVHYQKYRDKKHVDTGATERVELGEKALYAMLRGDGYKLKTRGPASREVMELTYKDGERSVASRTEFTCRG